MSVSRPLNVVSVGCLNPVKASSDSPVNYYPCGKCAHCLLMKSFKHSRETLLEMFSEYGKPIYPLFVLLTYENSYIPLVEIHYRTISDKICHIDVIDTETGEYIKENEVLTIRQLKVIHHHANKQNLRTLGIYPEPLQREGKIYFAVQSTRDLQNFIKRVRIRVQRKGFESFRFAACSEYGPSTNRPHYHVLFFCTSAAQRRAVADTIKCIKNPAWKYGAFNALYYSGSGADYICSYINGIAQSSPLLSRVPQFRPRFFHSNQLGRETCERMFGTLRETYSKLPQEWLSSVASYVNGNIIDIFPLDNYIRSMYPKCFGFHSLDFWTKCEMYTSAFKYYGKYGSTELVNQVVSSIRNKSNLFPEIESLVLASKFSKFPTEKVGVTPDGIYSIRKYKRTSYEERLRSRIYKIVSVSYKFRKNLGVLYDSSVFENPYQLWFASIDYVRYIESVYCSKEYNLLCNQLEKQEKIGDYYTWGDIAPMFYDNPTSCYGANSVPSLCGRLDLEVIRTNNPLRCNYKNFCLSRQNDQTKHKKIKEKTTLKQFYSYGKK